jgi:hypothetical protein
MPMVSRAAAPPSNSRSAFHRQQARRDEASATDHAVRLVHQICCLAGSATLIDADANGSDVTKLRSAINRRDTPALFNWLIAALSYQGISDQVAFGYMERHGYVTWSNLERGLGQGVTCPKLESYWHFHGCRYDKISRTCAEPDHIQDCPLPSHDLRNGRLNQTAYSLFLFIRDVCDGDLVGWIDARLAEADSSDAGSRLGQMQAALIEPLREIYGVSDKVVAMALSCLLLAAPKRRPLWIEAGVGMIAVDTLVHNFLHRTGILHRFDADHPYGMACYRPGGCASIVAAVAGQIDARQFNPAYPRTFLRFVQHAIWRYCSQAGFDVCNGNRIDDSKPCQNVYCRVHSICDHIFLSKPRNRP